ncbi:3-methyladenine DNA glycosylase [Streptosporangium sp. NBC_01756]|uniref:3-methyladenine DNA glycosylase n=1 Tax=Streptosporangium sp. NBC_01756 TaxID=2975950 RepID=UPI002DD93B25|nr:3-methyladenine DNA glycosylase [Streptosporangium sp. NBC_01756]WSC90092.1 3-methyladenine DNA glycosylase [Streptosporangium sp. NBC_01756]
MEVLEPEEWQARAEAHRRRVEAWAAPHLARRARGEAHPIEDFLFTYYGHRPARLRQWHPGAGVVLKGASGFGRDYLDTSEGVTLDTGALMDRRGPSVEWIARLLAATAARPAFLGCFGLHEWAMVYKTVEVRHGAWPLRLSGEEIAEVVEQRGVRCGHFDAFRFFTPEARPLNALQPTRERQQELEQPGCLHANMDLYKWAYKLSPLVSGELVADCFMLARDIRAVDMRASPYDLSSLGHRAIRIETPEGRAEYAAEQRGFAERARPQRQRLLDACERLLAGTRRP